MTSTQIDETDGLLCLKHQGEPTMKSQINPMLPLLEQMKAIAERQEGIPIVVNVDYDCIAQAVIKAYREEQERKAKDPKVLIKQAEAYKRYGRRVVVSLVRRGKLQKYQFDLREEEDEEGNIEKSAAGNVYYRVAEIERAIEEGNVLKGTRRIQIE